MPVTVFSKSASNTRSRGLIIGSPNTGKTYLLKLIVDSGESVIALSMPDEKGTKSIPESNSSLTALILQAETLSENASLADHYKLSQEKYAAVLQTTRKILKGDYGEASVLFIDGISKLYEVIMDVVSKGKYLEGQQFDPQGDYSPRLYGSAHALIRNYFSEVYESKKFPIIISTCWEKVREADENASKDEIVSHIRAGKRVWLPALPGQMANLATGEFDWCVRSGLTLPANCTHCIELERSAKGDAKLAIARKGLHLTYQLKPYDDVQCVGVKGRSVDTKYTFIHQDWKILKALII